MPEGILAHIQAAAADPSVKAIVLIGGGKTFIAGADIKEFGKITSGKKSREIGLYPTLLAIENAPKPVVCAIHGTAFGGGLEIRAGLPLPRRRAECAGGAAGGEARNHPGAAGHAAVAATGRRRARGRDVRAWGTRSPQSRLMNGASSIN